MSDNVDTLVGLRFAGISGVHAKTKSEVINIILDIKQKKDIALVLVSEKLVSLCEDWINEFKLNTKKPIIIQVSDRHGNLELSKILSRHIQEAIGIKI